MTKYDFTFRNYRELLALIGATHRFGLFCDQDGKGSGERQILLRHDIDFSMRQALKMAALEAEQGVRATYFLLFSSPFYNLLDCENIAIARAIGGLGHEIGLHYDIGAIESGNPAQPLEVLDAEARLLGVLCGQDIVSIAMHNPSVSGADIFRDSRYINAYAQAFTREMAYFSDSCMAWRDPFFKHLDSGTFPDRFQLLIHPMMWSENVLTRWEKLDEFISTKLKFMEGQHVLCRRMWESHAGVIENDLRESQE